MVEFIRQQKEVFGVVIMIIVGTISALAWASSNFVTNARGEVMMERTLAADAKILAQTSASDNTLLKQLTTLSDKIETSNELLLTHIERYSLDKIRTEIRTNKSETFALQQFVRVNGSDAQSEARLQQLKTELSELELKKTCTINHNPLCD